MATVTYFPHPQALHSQAIKRQWGIQTLFNRLEIRLLNAICISFYSQVFRVATSSMPSCHPSPLHATGCSMLLHRKDHSSYQKSTNHLVVCHRLPHLPHALCQTPWKLLETSATFSRSRQTCPPKRFGQKGGKGKFNWLELQHGQTISAEPRVHLGHNSSGQVRYGPMLTIIPRFFSSEENFSNSFTFCSEDHARPLTTALRAEGKLCWRIKPQAPVGAPADQIILMEENCYEIFVLNHKWRNKKKTVCKDHLLFKAIFPGKVRQAAPSHPNSGQENY